MTAPVVVGLCAQKGGACKTTTAIELATQASLNDLNALVIDFDPQGSLSDVLGIENEESATVYDVLAGDVEPADAVQRYDAHGVRIDVIAANETLAYVGSILDRDFNVLADRIANVCDANEYDLVIIDSAPMPQTSMAFNVFAASDWVIMPTRTTRQAVKSLTKTVQTMQAFADANLGSPKIAGVLIGDYDARGATWQMWHEGIERFCEARGIRLFDTHIRHTVKVEDAQTAHAPVSLFSPHATASLDYRAFCADALSLMGLGVIRHGS